MNLIYYRKSVFLLIMVSVALLMPGQIHPAKPLIVKMATLAPEGSPWHQVLQEIGEDWREISKNRVRLRIYAGGVAGDESDMVRKMRIGQIQAAALTAEGLSYIDKGIYGLSYPMMVKDYRELDWVREQVEPELVRRYETKGFKVLTWADVGFVYWFTRQPVRTPQEMQSQRIFTWAGDPNSPRLWKAAGFQPVSLSATDVLPGLQTGLIDAVSSSPLTVASFQWFGIANNMTDMPWAAMTGAVIMSKEAWDQIPADLQPQLMEAVDHRSKRIQDEIRYSDDDAVEVMKGYGLTVVEADESAVAAWRALIDDHGKSLRGTLIDTTMFDRIMEINELLHQPGFVLP
jgi:TRAP-type C4-dicarboxylate transport system substrate-binding protein